MRATEAECEDAIIAAAKLGGWLVHAERTSRTPSGRYSTAIKGHTGFPDLVLCHPYHRWLIFAELKRKPNRVEPAQTRWLDALRVATIGDAVVWWVPDNLDTICRSLAAGEIPKVGAP